MTEPAKPLPRITDDNRPFWEACQQGELHLPYCQACNAAYWPPSPLCPTCFEGDVGWRKASGRGTVSSFVVVHQKWFPAFADDLPYNAAQVELEEGPRITTSLVEIDNDAISVGMAVEAVFDAVTPELTLPRFRPRP